MSAPPAETGPQVAARGCLPRVPRSGRTPIVQMSGERQSDEGGAGPSPPAGFHPRPVPGASGLVPPGPRQPTQVGRGTGELGLGGGEHHRRMQCGFQLWPPFSRRCGPGVARPVVFKEQMEVWIFK